MDRREHTETDDRHANTHSNVVLLSTPDLGLDFVILGLAAKEPDMFVKTELKGGGVLDFDWKT